MHGVHQRQPLRGLHHAEHELAGDPARFLVHAKGAQVVGQSPLAMDAHCREIVEHDGQLLIEHRAQLLGDTRLDHFGTLHQRVHGAQQLVMGDRLRHAWHRHGFQPLQATELGVRSTQPIEDHRPHQCFGIEIAPRRAQRTLDRGAKTQALPEFVQRKHIPEGPRALVLDGLGGVRATPECAIQAVDERIEFLRFELIESPKVGDHPLSHRTGVGAEGLHNLQVAAATRSADARVHVATVSRFVPLYRGCTSVCVTLHESRKIDLKPTLTD